jgi:hypothetical protein
VKRSSGSCKSPALWAKNSSPARSVRGPLVCSMQSTGLPDSGSRSRSRRKGFVPGTGGSGAAGERPCRRPAAPPQAGERPDLRLMGAVQGQSGQVRGDESGHACINFGPVARSGPVRGPNPAHSPGAASGPHYLGVASCMSGLFRAAVLPMLASVALAATPHIMSLSMYRSR